MAVRIRNTGTEVYRDRYDGEQYEVGPGEVVVVPDGAAALWLGRTMLPGKEGREERRRAAARRGGTYPTLEVAPILSQEGHAPTQTDADGTDGRWVCPECGEDQGHHMTLRKHLREAHGIEE